MKAPNSFSDNTGKFFSVFPSALYAFAALSLLFAAGIAAPAPAADLEDFSFRLSQSSGSTTLWTRPPSEKIFEDSLPPDDSGSRIPVYAAKNEFEPFVVAVRTTASGNKTVSVSGVPSGVTVSPFLVDTVNLANATDVLGRTGPYPDPLTPFSSGASHYLTANKTQSFWFQVYVSAGASAGDHDFSVEIGGISIPVRLHIFDFALPEQPSVKSQMNLDHQDILERYGVTGTGDKYWKYVDKIKQFMIDHRLTPKAALWSGGLTSGGAPYIGFDCGANTFNDTDGIWGFEEPAARYLNGTGRMVSGSTPLFDADFNNGGGFPSFMALTFRNNDPSSEQRPDSFCSISRGGAWMNASSAYNQRWREYMGAVEDYLQGLGLLDKAYYYMANEPQNQADYDVIAWYASQIKSEAPNLKLMVSEPPRPEIYANAAWSGAKIDIWLPVLNQFDPVKSRDRAVNHNEDTWIYFLHGTRPPYFNPVTIDHPGVEGKLTGWFLWKYRIRGIAYYSMNDWSPNPWTSPAQYGQNGNAFLLYPPDKNGGNITYGATDHRLTSSIRMAMLRDGLEDFEYFRLLSGGAMPDHNVTNAADEQVNKIITGTTGYTRNGEFLYNLRRLIGLKIEGGIAAIPDVQPPAGHPRAGGFPGNYYYCFITLKANCSGISLFSFF